MPTVTIDITKVVELLVGLCSVLITTVLIPWLKTKLSAEQEAATMTLITLAVTAAEQVYSDPQMGQEKKEFVIDWLAKRGVKLDGEKLDTMIEAAVYELTHIKGALPAAKET